MKWLFLMFLVDTSLGEARPRFRVHAVFKSEAECNKLGAEVAADIGFKDESLKSFSLCMPESVFKDVGLQSAKID